MPSLQWGKRKGKFYERIAHISQGYSVGSILKSVNRTLTSRRIDQMNRRPLKEKEFVSALSSCPVTSKEENEKFQQFTATVTGLAARRALVKAIKSGEDPKDKKKDSKPNETKEQAIKNLDAINNDEQKVLLKVNKKKGDQKKKSKIKDW